MRARAKPRGGPDRAVAFRARRPCASRRTDAQRRRPGDQPRPADDTLSRVETQHSGGRLARRPGERDRDRPPAPHAARRHHARPAGAGRRDLPPHAVRRARSRARDGKRVRLELQGQSTEIDKFLIERMMDPVLHLVRNAVSHGIETVEERLAAGKRPEGTIVLSRGDRGRYRPHRHRRRWARRGCGGGRRAGARGRAAGTAGHARRRARCLPCCARPVFRRATNPTAPAAAASAWAWSSAAVDELSGTLRLETEKGHRHPLRARTAGDARDHRRADRKGRRARHSRCRRARSARSSRSRPPRCCRSSATR